MKLTQENHEALQEMFHHRYMTSPPSTWKRFLEDNSIESRSSVPISWDGYVVLYGYATLNDRARFILVPMEFAERALILGFLP